METPALRRQEGVDESELDLAMRLELARKNSENQHIHRKPVPVVDEPVEETIYEGSPETYAMKCLLNILQTNHHRPCALLLGRPELLRTCKVKDQQHPDLNLLPPHPTLLILLILPHQLLLGMVDQNRCTLEVAQ